MAGVDDLFHTRIDTVRAQRPVVNAEEKVWIGGGPFRYPSFMATAGDEWDGYRLLHRIGKGGFGEVWVCEVIATGELRALKHLTPKGGHAHLQQEWAAVVRYRKLLARLHSPHLLALEHLNRVGEGFFYTMRLADGLHGGDPRSPDWRPHTLASEMELRRQGERRWFLPQEVVALIQSVVAAARALSSRGVVHRDIKPDNLLYLGGRLCLADISLLGEDIPVLSGRGTLGYAPPSWYRDPGCNPDMWGIAAVLFQLLTGHEPDKMGLNAYAKPVHGEPPLGEEELQQWRALYAVVLRATREYPQERYLTLEALEAAIVATPGEPAQARTVPAAVQPPGRVRRGGRAWRRVAGALLLVAAGVWIATHLPEHEEKRSEPLAGAKPRSTLPLPELSAEPIGFAIPWRLPSQSASVPPEVERQAQQLQEDLRNAFQRMDEAMEAEAAAYRLWCTRRAYLKPDLPAASADRARKVADAALVDYRVRMDALLLVGFTREGAAIEAALQGPLAEYEKAGYVVKLANELNRYQTALATWKQRIDDRRREVEQWPVAGP